MSNGKQKVDIAVLQEQVKALDEKIEMILSNHLPHLEERLRGIELKLAYYAGGIVVLLSAVDIATRYFFK